MLSIFSWRRDCLVLRLFLPSVSDMHPILYIEKEVLDHLLCPAAFVSALEIRDTQKNVWKRAISTWATSEIRHQEPVNNCGVDAPFQHDSYRPRSKYCSNWANSMPEMYPVVFRSNYIKTHTGCGNQCCPSCQYRDLPKAFGTSSPW